MGDDVFINYLGWSSEQLLVEEIYSGFLMVFWNVGVYWAFLIVGFVVFVNIVYVIVYMAYVVVELIGDLFVQFFQVIVVFFFVFGLVNELGQYVLQVFNIQIIGFDWFFIEVFCLCVGVYYVLLLLIEMVNWVVCLFFDLFIECSVFIFCVVIFWNQFVVVNDGLGVVRANCWEEACIFIFGLSYVVEMGVIYNRWCYVYVLYKICFVQRIYWVGYV